MGIEPTTFGLDHSCWPSPKANTGVGRGYYECNDEANEHEPWKGTIKVGRLAKEIQRIDH